VVLGIAGALLLALLIILAGVVYDRFVVPGRTVRSVNGETLSRGEYDQVARRSALQQIAQSAQFAKLLGANASFGQDQGSFSQQIVQTNQQLAQLGTIRGRSQPIADEAVSQWIDAQLVEQNARTQFQINPSQGEVDQLIVERLGNLLQQPATATSAAGTETAAAGTSSAGTSAAGTTGPAAAAATTATAATSATVSPTSGPTPTASPTVPPTASPVAAVATQKANQIFGIIFDEYKAVLNDLPKEASPDLRSTHATQEDFANALRAQYRDELIRTRVKEKLVPRIKANDTSEPTQIHARHILLKVPKPSPTPTPAPNATPAATDTAAAETTTAQPTPTPTLAPAALEALFAERKKEADAIYQQVKSKPDTFAEVAQAKSEDEGSASKGGDLGTFGKGQMVKPFEEAAFKLKENEISQPVRSDFGWHIIQRLPEDPKEKLERQRQTAFDEWLANLRKSATIVPAPTPSPTAPPAPSEAQTENPPAPEATGGAPSATQVPAAPPQAAPEGTTTTP
jgi:parvulin-like peptidyl-prolyl isomerase